MNQDKKELLNARRIANAAASQEQKQALLPTVDNRVRLVTYTNLDGEERERYCQDFKIAVTDANACSIMWLGDVAAGDPLQREIMGYTFQIKEVSVERLNQTWEEHLNGNSPEIR